MRGQQLLAELRRQGPRGRVPILAVTAEAMVGDEARLLEAGFDGYLAKPLDVARFVEVVEQHLRGSGPPAASEPVVSTPKKRRPQREPTTRNPAFRSRLETLRTRFAISLPRQVAELRDALEHARGGDPQAALARAHRIAGAAGSFGFEREGQLARTIEEAIRGLQAADRLREAGQEWQEIDAAMGELLAVVGE